MKPKFTKTKDNFLQLSLIEEPIIKQETIKKIKQELSDVDLEDDDLKKLKEKREKSGYDRITKGLLFIECLDKLKESINNIKITEKTEIEEYLKKVDSKKLRNLIEDHHNEYGIYLTGEKIKDIVNEKNKNIEQTINLFFKIFGDED